MESNSDLQTILPETRVRPRSRLLYTPTIEPVIFLVIFGTYFTYAVSQNIILKLTCSTVFGYNETLCNQFGSSNLTEEVQQIQTSIQPYVAQVLMALTVANDVGQSLTGIFFGAWSDKFGRRPLLLLSIAGLFSSSILSTYLAYLSTKYVVNPWIFLLTTIPSNIFGGFCSVFGAAYCYIADVTTPSQRPIRITIFSACVLLSTFLASLSSGYASDIMGDTAIFAIGSAVFLISLVYLVLFVPESLDEDKLERSSKIKGLFQCGLVKDMTQTLFQRRSNYDRMILLICMSGLCAANFINDGTDRLTYLYVTKAFSWSLKDFTTYNAISTVVLAIGGTVAITIFQKLLGISLVSIILIGLGSNFIENIVRTFATQSWHMYFAVSMGVSKGAAFATIRSLIATVVPSKDVGKVYSLATALETIVAIGAAPLYTYVYNLTFNSFIGAFYSISVTLNLICFVLFTIVFGLETRYPSIINGTERQ